MEPLRSLRYTKSLQLGDDYAMESLPEEWLLQNAASLHSIEIGVSEALRSLPSVMEKLGSLQSLHIERAPLIQSLPQLPASLCKLVIWGCNTMFLKRYESGGEDWGKIAHIAAVDIKAYSEGVLYLSSSFHLSDVAANCIFDHTDICVSTTHRCDCSIT